jgi:sigma-B regulation protein RsbU (phosphoserine phosphatase)
MPDVPATIKVLLIDDQAIVGETIRRMLANEPNIAFEYCADPTEAIRRANDFGPTVILQDLVMPEVDGLTLVRFFRANPRTRDVPLIVLSSKEEPIIKAESFARGANDYLVKLPDRIELVARIRYHSRGYIALQERNEAYRRLAESRQQLANEMDQAAKYVQSLLPRPVTTGPVRTDWRFVPSLDLGGDSFGYHWLDDDHFAIYLLDVSGHGVGASLLSVSAMNVLGSQSLANVDFRDPTQVLERLDVAFDMDRHDGKYFTIWYGVYQPSVRLLRYAGAGHPPAALLSGPTAQNTSLTLLESSGPIIGCGCGIGFETSEITLPDYARMYVFSDGAFEIQLPDGRMWTQTEFLTFLEARQAGGTPMDDALAHFIEIHGSKILDDDCSIVQCDF